MANKVKLNFRFHNPNTVEEAASYILKAFLEANQKKFERVLQESVKGKMFQAAETGSHSE
ncbi:hypothetical protein D3Z51_06920 [Clostridiaceae bacterium]|nr:hypothetical protein [Clostridiaceae bacterium]RKI15260.1 hypothetical protein D7V81_06410 [bacterium 1XD21-70]